jgi:hypothetical protein
MDDDQEYRKTLRDYRALLIEGERKSQEDYDKTLITLSGGALGVSFAFVKDIVGDNPITCTDLLLWSWIFWGISLFIMLLSFYFGQRAFRKAINQVDQGNEPDIPGGIFSPLTQVANVLGGVFFLVGIVLIAFFANYNLR